MDLEQIISFLRSSFDSPTPDTGYDSRGETLVQPLQQPSCSNQSLALLDAFCSDEDTAKSNLLDIDEVINQKNEGQFFDSSFKNRSSPNGNNNPSDGLSIESLNLSTLNTDLVLQCETLAGQPFPQSPCSNQSLALLKAFCTDEDTVKSYLLDDDEFNNHNYEGQQFLNSPITTLDLGANENLSPVATPISSQISTDPLAIEPLYHSKLNNPYENLKMNFIHLVKHGFKMSLSLNTNNSEIDEPWNANVGQKILSVYFSTLSLRSEYWPDDVKLDGFESLLMDEACAAFKDQRYLNLFAYINDRLRASPVKLISICDGIKGYRKIATSDKITLLSNIYYHLHTMDGVINYDWKIDGWDFPASDFKFDRRDTFIFDKPLHDGLNYVIETFPDRFRNDINVVILIYLIAIFNGDTAGLKYPEMIRHEQFTYIYLLRRYLRTVCESDCEASDNHYRLMVKIEHVRLLTEKTKNKFFRLLHEPLLETITKEITLGVPKKIPQMFQTPHLKT